MLKARHAWISRTVLLETEWVLRSVYKFSREQIHEFLQLLLQAENAEVENSLAVTRALEWYQCGADFADALHLAVCGSTVMHTFNRGFCKAAREAGLTPEVHVWEV